VCRPDWMFYRATVLNVFFFIVFMLLHTGDVVMLVIVLCRITVYGHLNSECQNSGIGAPALSANKTANVGYYLISKYYLSTSQLFKITI